jgi:hypothetical protein
VLFPVSMILLLFDGVKTDGLKDLWQLCNRCNSGERCQILGESCSQGTAELFCYTTQSLVIFSAQSAITFSLNFC